MSATPNNIADGALHTGATNKYDQRGMLKRGAAGANSCNWSSMSSAGAAVSQSDIDKLELQQLMKSDQVTDEYVQVSDTARKRRRLDIVSAKASVELETKYAAGDIRSYCPDPAAFGKDERKIAHEQWARFFVVCNVPLSLFDHPLFKIACKSLRPSYEPPSSTTVTDTWCPLLCKEDDDALKEEIDGKKIWVSADGSDNRSKDPVVHILGTGHFGTRLYRNKWVKINRNRKRNKKYININISSKHR